MLKRINHHFYAVAASLFALLTVFFGGRLAGDSAKVVDLAFLVVSAAFLAITVIAGLLEDLEHKLEKWLERGTGSGSDCATTSQRTHRQEMELAVASNMAIYAGQPANSGKLVGESLKNALDAMLGTAMQKLPVIDPMKAAMDGLTRGAGYAAAAGRVTVGDMEPHEHSAGYQADQAAEAEIVAAGLTAPRVTAEQIQALMDTLTWRYEHHESPQIVFAHAFIDGFYLATGFSKPVSAENFNAALGQKYAREQAEGKARDKLWELEGWALHRALGAGA